MSSRLSSVSTTVMLPSLRPPREFDFVGIATFWCVVTTAALATLLLYCWPAISRIERQSQALTQSKDALEKLRADKARLEAERVALDDPFYLERVLRVDYHWQPKPGASPALAGSSASSSVSAVNH